MGYDHEDEFRRYTFGIGKPPKNPEDEIYQKDWAKSEFTFKD